MRQRHIDPVPPPALHRLVSQERAHTAVLALVLGLLLAKSWARCAEVHRRRTAGRSAGKPRTLQRWEGEGGRPEEPPVGGGMAE